MPPNVWQHKLIKILKKYLSVIFVAVFSGIFLSSISTLLETLNIFTNYLNNINFFTKLYH